jgi:hypothetical protein
VAILTIVLGYAQASCFEVVRRSRHWSTLFESYTRAMRWSAYATASFLIGLLADRDSDPHPVVTALCTASLLMSAAVLARMLWITERVVRVVITPGARRPGRVGVMEADRRVASEPDLDPSPTSSGHPYKVWPPRGSRIR